MVECFGISCCRHTSACEYRKRTRTGEKQTSTPALTAQTLRTSEYFLSFCRACHPRQYRRLQNHRRYHTIVDDECCQTITNRDADLRKAITRRASHNPPVKRPSCCFWLALVCLGIKKKRQPEDCRIFHKRNYYIMLWKGESLRLWFDSSPHLHSEPPHRPFHLRISRHHPSD